jgi:nucleoid DNA-binding protein
MRTTEFCEIVADTCGMSYTKKTVARVLRSSIELIADLMSRGDGLAIHGFGRFGVRAATLTPVEEESGEPRRYYTPVFSPHEALVLYVNREAASRRRYERELREKRKREGV